MKQIFLVLILAMLTMACQTESLDIQAPYRIKLNVTNPGAQLHLNQVYTLPLELLTDSYYARYGYALQFYQQTGLGQLKRVAGDQPEAVLQKVPVALPLGVSSWQYTPGAVGASQIVLVAQQERGYTQPDTVRLTFQVIP